MSHIVALLMVLFLVQGCGHGTMTPEGISAENKAIGIVANDFWRAEGSKK